MVEQDLSEETRTWLFAAALQREGVQESTGRIQVDVLVETLIELVARGFSDFAEKASTATVGCSYAFELEDTIYKCQSSAGKRTDDTARTMHRCSMYQIALPEYSEHLTLCVVHVWQLDCVFDRRS